jgi:primosomal replication protein N
MATAAAGMARRRLPTSRPRLAPDSNAAATTENKVLLRGRLVERDALRHTPAGIPIVNFRVEHESTQAEGGVARQVGCEMSAVAVQTEAKLLSAAPLGTQVRIEGFLDRQGKGRTRVVLHATRIEFVTPDS